MRAWWPRRADSCIAARKSARATCANSIPSSMPLTAAAEVVAHAHQRPATLVEVDGLIEPVFWNALPTHFDPALCQDAQDGALAKLVDLHQNYGPVWSCRTRGSQGEVATLVRGA
jgi:hypothetical protein